jgi:predicted RNA binding protein YcfA (HicA-like mRNA interferase family)
LSKLPRDVTGKEFLRALSKRGWYEDHQVGSHVTIRATGQPGKKIVVPVHGSRPLKPALLRRALREADLSIEDFINLL